MLNHGEKVIEHSLMNVYLVIAEESPPTTKSYSFWRWRNPWQWLRNETTKAKDENGEVCCEANEFLAKKFAKPSAKNAEVTRRQLLWMR